MASSSLGTAASKPIARLLGKQAERHRLSMDLPERFLVEDEDDEEDAARGSEDNPQTYVQQSMYGVIAAAQSKGSFRPKFQPESGSDSDTEDEGGRRGSGSKDVSRASNGESAGKPSVDDTRSSRPESSRHRKNKSLSESKLLRPFLKPGRERSDSRTHNNMTHSQFLPPREPVSEKPEMSSTVQNVRSDATMMDRKLQAKARADMEALIAPSGARESREGTPPAGASRTKASVGLPGALAEIFQFESPEEVISEYPCWYLQSVLLQGYMYITQKHVCFYAYLQKKGNVVLKSGHLAKQGKHTSRWKRCWYILKGDVLSYYSSSAQPYFPRGTIDLRYGIAAELSPEKGQESKDVTSFTIATEDRTYFFRADSHSSAKEWVRQLQKVIFRSRNDGDSVKISLPIENIVDVEPNPVLDFAETIKIRVMDDDETFAIDEYFFTFFSRGADALTVLSLMTHDNEAKKTALEVESELPIQKMRRSPFRRSISTEISTRLAPMVTERIRSTLSPPTVGDSPSPRHSIDQARSSGERSRTSFDRGRPSFDKNRRSISGSRRTSFQLRSTSKSPLSQSAQESLESFVTSSRSLTNPSLTVDGRENDMSASQILTGDTAFQAPTLRAPQPMRTVSGSTVERLRRESRDPSPHSPSSEGDFNQPPTVRQTLRDGKPRLGRTGTSDSAKLNDGSKLQLLETAPSAGPMRAIATPLQHAFTLAGVVRDQGKRMSSYLSSSPKNYYDRFSGAIAGGKRHYLEADGLTPEDRINDPECDLDVAEHERRFQEHFSLPSSEKLRAVYYCWLHRVLPLYGKIYLSDRRFCFRSLLYGTRTKLVVSFKDIENVGKEKGFRWRYPGMVLVIRGHEEVFFDFSTAGDRDDCAVTVLRNLDVLRAAMESMILTDEERVDAEAAAAENDLLQDARKDRAVHDPRLLESLDQPLSNAPPILFDDPNASVLDFKPKKSLRITCLTIGSRGDVQPYIALCKGLIEDGHRAKIATHGQFKEWVERHGVEFAEVAGDPAVLMRMCVENGMFTPSFLYEANSKFRGWLDGLLKSSWIACQGSDLLIESPSAMAGVHIAEALGIPYFRAFTMPWTKTRAYPHAFATPNKKMGGIWNYNTYALFDYVFWQATASQINRWRGKTLHLRPTDAGKLQLNKVPFLYNFSPSVVPPPLDFSDWIRITGYWFLDESHDWKPPEDLLAFIAKAKKDNMKLVYIGFGSVPVSDSKLLTQQIVDAVVKADVRCILSKGWSDHFDNDADKVNKTKYPPAIFEIRAAPHDWLFQQIDAAVHHGGAGTTGASLRAGVPTVIKPFFGDQFFFATRVEDMGVGVYLKKITVNALGKAIWCATHDERMRTKARMLGEQIRQENGVETAINAIYRDLEYAKTLIKKRTVATTAGGEEEDAEESWTFVENESDVDVTGARRESDAGGFVPSLQHSRAHVRQSSLGSIVFRSRVT